MQSARRRRRLVALSYRFLRRGQRYLPPLVRGFMGLVLIALGIVGFLPVLGFWMIPLGLALLATDVPPLRRWFTRWLNTHRRKHHPKLQRELQRERHKEPSPGPPY